MRHFAISAANFSISLVLQKQQSFKHKRRFFKVLFLRKPVSAQQCSWHGAAVCFRPTVYYVLSSE